MRGGNVLNAPITARLNFVAVCLFLSASLKSTINNLAHHSLLPEPGPVGRVVNLVDELKLHKVCNFVNMLISIF